MPTSATGADRRRHEAGFTLVELMVVLVIVGLMASVAVMTVPRGPSLAAQADQFAARLTRAKEEAVLTNRAIGVRLTAQGYAFRARTADGWVALDSGPFKTTPWAEGVTAELGEGEAQGQVSFESTGVADPAMVVLTRDGQRRRISVDAAGNVRIDEQG
jgi:general secretion pathway protein H